MKEELNLRLQNGSSQDVNALKDSRLNCLMIRIPYDTTIKMILPQITLKYEKQRTQDRVKDKLISDNL